MDGGLCGLVSQGLLEQLVGHWQVVVPEASWVPEVRCEELRRLGVMGHEVLQCGGQPKGRRFHSD